MTGSSTDARSSDVAGQVHSQPRAPHNGLEYPALLVEDRVIEYYVSGMLLAICGG
jgi:hypothetical protein